MLFPVTLSIKPSRRLRAALAFVHLAAAIGLFSLVTAGIAAVLAAGLLLSLWHCVKVASHPLVLTLGDGGGLEWHHPGGTVTKAEALADSTNFGWLVVLRFRVVGETRRRTAIVLADSLPAEDRRRLQIWMRWILPFRRESAAG